MEKKCQIYRISSKEIGELSEGSLVLFLNDDNKLHLNIIHRISEIKQSEKKFWVNSGMLINKYLKQNVVKKQHLYITSDEKIKENNFYIYRIPRGQLTIKQSTENLDSGFEVRKIIASTNTQLGLPQISESFIREYIKAYNGNDETIEDITVKYGYTVNKEMGHFNQFREYFVKTDSKNCVDVKRTKTSYSREEVIELIRKFNKEATIGGDSELMEKFKSTMTYPQIQEKWIKENL